MTIEEELELIRERSGGVLLPEKVVEFAKNANTALHSQFEWDDAKAGHEFRLHQARNVIRVRVRVEPRINEETKVYVSLPSDRKSGGGYRALVEVMNDDERRDELLRMALGDFQVFRRKYEQLTQLAPVFEAIDMVQVKLDAELRSAAVA